MLYHKAIEFATLAHQGQLRKGSGVPYIAHPFEVSLIIARNSTWTVGNKDYNDSCVIAGILHDTLEDTKTTYEDIKCEFGEIIANIVLDNTEDKSKSWEERKQHTINVMGTKCLESQMVCYADKLSNLKSFLHDYEKLGDVLWDRFKRGKDKQKWYYNGLMENCFNRFSANWWYKEFVDTYHELFE